MSLWALDKEMSERALEHLGREPNGMLDARCQVSAVPSDGALVLWYGRV